MNTARLQTLLPTACLLLAATLPALAQPQAQATSACIDIEVHNVRPNQGNLMLAAYLDADSYGKKPVAQVRVAAGEATTRVQLCGLPAATGFEVALMGFQDLDSDGKMGRNALGMPTEPWGSSGTPGTFGPKWDTGRVALNGAPVVVKMVQ